METSALISYYSNLLAIQFKTQTRAIATIEALATEVIADQIFTQVRDGFNLDTAIGAQLDILAQYVGAPRQIFGYDPDVPYFALPGYDDTPEADTGWASYSDVIDPVGYWLSYFSGTTAYTLTDGQLRLLIKYFIAVHKSDHTVASIDLILQEFFGTYATLTDNEDMSIVYNHDSSDPNFLFSIVNQLNKLPHPGGVAVTVNEV